MQPQRLPWFVSDGAPESGGGELRSNPGGNNSQSNRVFCGSGDGVGGVCDPGTRANNAWAQIWDSKSLSYHVVVDSRASSGIVSASVADATSSPVGVQLN